MTAVGHDAALPIWGRSIDHRVHDHRMLAPDGSRPYGASSPSLSSPTSLFPMSASSKLV